MTNLQRPTHTKTYQQTILQKLPQLFMLSAIIILIGGGIALLWQYQQQGLQNGHAAGDVSVVGPPTLSAATVNTIFARLGSPMVGTGKLVEQASRQTNIDDAFALGVWWAETNDGAAGVGLADHNPGSVRGSVGYPSAFDGYTIYPSYTVAISYWFNLLRNNYVNRGLSTVYSIARPYVATTRYPIWAGKVIALMFNYRGIAPPPPVATSTPQPAPTIDPNIVAAKLYQQYKRHDLMQISSSLSTADSNLLNGRGQAQETYGMPQANINFILPRTTEFAVVIFGLLVALAIASYAFRLNVGKILLEETSSLLASAGHGSREAELSIASLYKEFTPITDNLPPLPEAIRLPTRSVFARQGLLTKHEIFAPITDDLPALSSENISLSESRLSSQRRVTETLPRRVVLLPPQSDPRAPEAVGAGKRPAGLLSRYAQTTTNPSI